MTDCTFVKKMEGFRGNAALYKLSDLVSYYNGFDTHESTNHVIISAIWTEYAHETYIFPANSDGHILSWLQMEGSTKNTMDHSVVVEKAGWNMT